MRPKIALLAAIAIMSSLAAGQQAKTVKVKPGFATVIVCPAQPELVTVGNPDQFSVQNSGRYVLVKPLVGQGTTNMFIKSGLDSYNLLLQVANKPDLEVQLEPRMPPAMTPAFQNGESASGSKAKPTAVAPAPKPRDTITLSPKAKSILSSYLKTPRRYTYSVVNSEVTFAVDHMTMIEDRLYIICTLLNKSSIPYDIGFVRFKLIEKASSYIFFSKKIKEEELEPIQEKYTERIKPNDSTRMLFVFDKHGFSDDSEIEIKCNEESGRRDLTVKLPGSFVE